MTKRNLQIQFINSVKPIDSNIVDKNMFQPTEALMSSKKKDKMNNTSIMDAAIKLLNGIKRFDSFFKV